MTLPTSWFISQRIWTASCGDSWGAPSWEGGQAARALPSGGCKMTPRRWPGHRTRVGRRAATQENAEPVSLAPQSVPVEWIVMLRRISSQRWLVVWRWPSVRPWPFVVSRLAHNSISQTVTALTYLQAVSPVNNKRRLSRLFAFNLSQREMVPAERQGRQSSRKSTGGVQQEEPCLSIKYLCCRRKISAGES